MSRIFPPLMPVSTILALLLLSACGSAATSSPAAGTGRSFSNGAGVTGGTNPLPPVTAYLVGTYKLEGTENAVDAKTATALVPLYQMLKELSGNSSTAQAEIDSVADQIKSAMTPAQLQAITAMNLTQQDLFALMQQLGGQSGRSGTARTPGAGGFNGGGPPGEFGGGPGGGVGGGSATTNTNQSATLAAARTQQAKAARLPSSALLTAIIQLLQQRAGIATDTPNGSATPAAGIPAATNTPTP